MNNYINNSNESVEIYIPDYCKAWPSNDLANAKLYAKDRISQLSDCFAKYDWTEDMIREAIRDDIKRTLPWVIVREYIHDVVDFPIAKKDVDLAEGLVKKHGSTKGEEMFRQAKLG